MKAPTRSGSASNRYSIGNLKVFHEKYVPSSFFFAVAGSGRFRAAKLAVSTPKPASQVAPYKVDLVAAYYHYALLYMYEEQVAVYGRSDMANKAIDEYHLAIQADPTSEYLTAGLAELYAKTGRIRDDVLEAQEILKRDSNNLEAHKLLGRIYLLSLGDVQDGSGSDSVLKLAISSTSR